MKYQVFPYRVTMFFTGWEVRSTEGDRRVCYGPFPNDIASGPLLTEKLDATYNASSDETVREIMKDWMAV